MEQSRLTKFNRRRASEHEGLRRDEPSTCSVAFHQTRPSQVGMARGRVAKPVLRSQSLRSEHRRSRAVLARVTA